MKYLKIILIKITFLLLLTPQVTGCGFQLRGAISLPDHLKTLIVMPNEPYDPFQRTLRQTLKLNGIRLVDPEHEKGSFTKLSIIKHEFSERAISYQSDGQTYQVLLKYTVIYQITDPKGKLSIDNQTAEVERELLTNPGAVLITESEREHLKADMTVEAALQLVRQLSTLPCGS